MLLGILVEKEGPHQDLGVFECCRGEADGNCRHGANFLTTATREKWLISLVRHTGPIH